MLTAAQFDYVSTLAYDIAGIRLASGKEGLVQSRLAKRVHALGLPSIEAYIDLVRGEQDAELSNLIDVLTTNKTSFFRESAHFDFIRERLVPTWLAESRTINIWSAGCSSGEEPYTLSMVLHDTMGAAINRVRILATDLSTVVLEKARTGVYSRNAGTEIPDAVQRRHLVKDATGWRVADHLRAPIRFARLNLMEEWPMRGHFDLILCRNVMIYFDNQTQERLVARYHAQLRPGAFLFVGHSESLSGLRHSFTYVQPAVYER
jgi:chemotaxis protein methyltransferase CheR